ncbi:MAG TPA: response regulator [Sphingomonas sp.]|jgi:DNA-binding response OmpR family regulator|nr:response regulator [Sphingomonas sp.]
MIDHGLHHCRILVVEDEYMLAEELAQELADAGAQVLGPVASIETAMALLDHEANPHGAILDVNLGGEPVFPLADTLIGRGIPVIFTTGYDPATLPIRFAHVRTCGKPFTSARVTEAIGSAIHA